MRLINTSTLELHEFNDNNCPKYAILSHTWGSDNEEATFTEMQQPAGARLPRVKAKTGYDKMVKTCELAGFRGLDYVWIDTCCIDKSSSAELTESINSMYRWYKEAEECYAYLADVHNSYKDPYLDLQERDTLHRDLFKCKWFLRGWTLQELIGPRTLLFYNRSWKLIGAKTDISLAHIVALRTKIPHDVLHARKTAEEYSVAVRFSWAAQRKTTRIEDRAYSLLGLFNVYMPLIYGEGHRAFRRLQEEIIRRSNDLTIFACGPKYTSSLLASSPEDFRSQGKITPFVDDFVEYSVTNKGVLFSGDIPLRIWHDGHADSQHHYGSFVGRDPSCMGGIALRKIGPRLFMRRDRSYDPLIGFSYGQQIEQVRLLDIGESFHVLTDMSSSTYSLSRRFRTGGLHVPRDESFDVVRVAPESLWDVADRIFLRPRPYRWSDYRLVMVFWSSHSQTSSELIVICRYDVNERQKQPCFWALDPSTNPEISIALEEAMAGGTVPVFERLNAIASFQTLTDTVVCRGPDFLLRTHVFAETGNFAADGGDVDVYVVRLHSELTQQAKPDFPLADEQQERSL